MLGNRHQQNVEDETRSTLDAPSSKPVGATRSRRAKHLPRASLLSTQAGNMGGNTGGTTGGNMGDTTDGDAGGTANATATGNASSITNPDVSNLRIVIHEVEPPLWAQLMRAFMHVICVVLLLAVLALGVPQFLGVREFNVMTGSMTPTYPVGTLVFTVPGEAAEIQVGDVVTCVMNEDLDVITHRVVANDTAAGTITTRGDANNNNDAPTLYANVLGVVRFSVPMLGGVIDYFTGSTTGRVTGIVLLGCVVVLTLLAESICNHLSAQTAEIYEEA